MWVRAAVAMLPAATRPDLDEELLAKLFRQELGDQTRDDVGRAARRLADDDFHRTRRIGLRAYGSREHRSTRCQMQELSTGKFHGVSPALHAIERELRCERESTVYVRRLPLLAALR